MVLGPITVLQSPSITMLGTIQRILGLTAFCLLFSQIVIGFFMDTLSRKLGDWVFKFHIFEGMLAYFLILLHPWALKLDPFYIFTDFCVLCSSKLELFYTFGRVSFWLVTVVVIAGLFKSWRKWHILSYLAFLVISIHSISFHRYWFYGPAILVVVSLAGYKLLKFFKKIPQKD